MLWWCRLPLIWILDEFTGCNFLHLSSILKLSLRSVNLISPAVLDNRRKRWTCLIHAFCINHTMLIRGEKLHPTSRSGFLITDVWWNRGRTQRIKKKANTCTLYFKMSDTALKVYFVWTWFEPNFASDSVMKTTSDIDTHTNVYIISPYYSHILHCRWSRKYKNNMRNP